MTRKIRYKEATKGLEKMAAPNFENNNRSSLGMENFVGEYYFISIEKLIPYQKQTRRNFNDGEIQELASTIKEHGIKTPLLVIPSEMEDGKFEVVCGERRLRAAKIVELIKVPCIIIDANQAEEIALIDNIQRADLHPIEIGNGINSLLSNADWGDVSKLAVKLGKDQPTISHYLSYSKLPQTIKQYLVDKNIRSREILRNLIKCETLEKMEEQLGIKENIKPSVSKSVLRINLNSEEVIIQDKSLYKLNSIHLQKIKKSLQEIIIKIDQLD